MMHLDITVFSRKDFCLIDSIKSPFVKPVLRLLGYSSIENQKLGLYEPVVLTEIASILCSLLVFFHLRT